MKKILITLMSAVLTLTISSPVFASENSAHLNFEQFKTELLEAKLEGNDKLIENYIENNPELSELYIQNTDAFDSNKVNEKLKNVKLGPNDSALIVMDDDSFVEVTTTTRPVIEENGAISTQGYERDYDMSGTKWNTDFKYEVGGIATLKQTAYYQIGSKMDIYQYDYSGTKGAIGITVSVKQSLSGNKTKTATLKGDYTIKGLAVTQYYTLYTEIGFIKAYLEDDGYYYVDYYIDSWASGQDDY
ncbi:hypothetical protein EHV15_10220 [Paenibacillus oralis]|uniref:Uncharacterized protein n=1 Tax=Paenibacillus oralis TaxID=2490856 RepID=A0A3P3TYQ4_9BACL|nr:hypothetical protein [Paenibacillus oralis]RRJ63252.1 hypothetical protein EHV15_10220 [Paenibacillus oralis]